MGRSEFTRKTYGGWVLRPVGVKDWYSDTHGVRFSRDDFRKEWYSIDDEYGHVICHPTLAGCVRLTRECIARVVGRAFCWNPF